MDASVYAMAAVDQKGKKGATFFLLVLYLVVEYARPAFMAVLHPALILQIVMIFYLLSSKKTVSNLLREKYFNTYLLLLLLMTLHVFIATNNYWAMVHFQTMLSYLVVSVALCTFLDSIEKLTSFVSFYVLVMAAAAVSRLAGSDMVGGNGHLGDENDFALAMNVALPISFFLARTAWGWRKLFFASASILFVLGNMTSQSRGGALGLAAVGAVCWVYSRNKLKALLAIVILLALAWEFAPPEFRLEMAEIGIESAESDTGKDRIELWKVAWRAFLDNPVLGVGQGNMPLVMEKYQYDETGESFWKRGLWGRAIHSIYFTMLPELGIVGVILLVMMFKDLVRKHRKSRALCRSEDGVHERLKQIDSLAIALMVSIFGYMVTGIFISAFYYPEFWNLAALVVALNLVASRTAESERPLIPPDGMKPWSRGWKGALE